MTVLAKTVATCVAVISCALLASQPASAQSGGATFFLTSNGIGNGGNLGGMAGADNHCQELAQAAGFAIDRDPLRLGGVGAIWVFR